MQLCKYGKATISADARWTVANLACRVFKSSRSWQARCLPEMIQFGPYTLNTLPSMNNSDSSRLGQIASQQSSQSSAPDVSQLLFIVSNAGRIRPVVTPTKLTREPCCWWSWIRM
jgi:hypothetical protein